MLKQRQQSCHAWGFFGAPFLASLAPDAAADSTCMPPVSRTSPGVLAMCTEAGAADTLGYESWEQVGAEVGAEVLQVQVLQGEVRDLSMKLEAKEEVLNRQREEQRLEVEALTQRLEEQEEATLFVQCKVQEVLSQMARLVEAMANEQQKGVRRDRELQVHRAARAAGAEARAVDTDANGAQRLRFELNADMQAQVAAIKAQMTGDVEGLVDMVGSLEAKFQARLREVHDSVVSEQDLQRMLDAAISESAIFSLQVCGLESDLRTKLEEQIASRRWERNSSRRTSGTLSSNSTTPKTPGLKSPRSRDFMRDDPLQMISEITKEVVIQPSTMHWLKHHFVSPSHRTTV